MGYIKKEGDGNLIYNVVNQDPEAEGTRVTTDKHKLIYPLPSEKWSLSGVFFFFSSPISQGGKFPDA